MLYIEFIIALIVAVALSLIFVFGFRRKGPWTNFYIFFLVIFLATWAGGLWITPIGPSIRGIFWLPYLMVGAIFALLLAAATPSASQTSIELKTKKQVKKEKKIETALSLFMWILIIALTAAIIVGYWFYPSKVLGF